MRYRLLLIVLLGLLGLGRHAAQTVVPTPDILATATGLSVRATEFAGATTSPVAPSDTPDRFERSATAIIQTATAAARQVQYTATPFVTATDTPDENATRTALAQTRAPTATPVPLDAQDADEANSNRNAFTQTIVAVLVLFGVLLLFAWVAGIAVNHSQGPQ